MDKKIEKILEIWHEHFSDESHQYSEFEKSDIEYFVGCMLYNHFAFSRAIDSMKTIDLSYDFLRECTHEYEIIEDIISGIYFDDDMKKLEFLQDYISYAKSKYDFTEQYLLNRLEHQTNILKNIYQENIDVKKVDFTSLKK
ncbi:hypothetical protein [Sulfurimonas sp.]|uniref:hypothetical protein n=1 Tax=Sulfurimonas sp. TaxID=2022749 RepID=UPI0025D3D263|nr:hypothetical protein [Sulfurimonas sp.]MDD5156885.1 hypothetical protein [Sulfurimonas sp.]